MRHYVVQQGDFLSRIAERLGFDANAVWNDDQNRDLRELRGSPDILAPGDVLRVPDAEPPPGVRITARSGNRYSGRLALVPVRVTVRMGDELLRNERCVVPGMTPPLETQTDGDGVLSFDAPHHARDLRVLFPARHFELALRVGDLDPISQRSGVIARLENLGYLLPADLLQLGPMHSRGDEEARQRRRMRHGLIAFQKDRGLTVTGELDDETRQALLERHGG